MGLPRGKYKAPKHQSGGRKDRAGTPLLPPFDTDFGAVGVRRKWTSSPFSGEHPASQAAMRIPALWKAAKSGETEKVRKSLANGADIEEKGGKEKCSPLQVAAHNGLWDVVVLLLEKGADVSSKNRTGSTPLHWSAGEGREEVAQLLVEKGANVQWKDSAGFTPEDRATEQSHVRIAAMLKAAAEPRAVAKIAATLTAAAETRAQQAEIARLRNKNQRQREEIARLHHDDAELESALEERDAQLAAKNQEIARLHERERAAKKRRGAADSATGSSVALKTRQDARLAEVKQEGVETTERLGQALQRQAQDAATIQLRAGQVQRLREKLQEVETGMECAICMERVADTALTCGHCYCCAEECGSSIVATCPECDRPVTGRTKLFGDVFSVEGLADV